MSVTKMVVNKLLILDTKEKVSNLFSFNSKTNILVGEDNKVGKSSLIKSIYYSLGMDNSNNMPTGWNYTDMIFWVTFSIDDNIFEIIRKEDELYLKEENGFENMSKPDLGQWYLHKFSLDFQLFSKSRDQIVYPGFLFVPFYLDQDNSWDQEPYRFPQVTNMYPNSERNKLWENYLGISNKRLESLNNEIKDKQTETSKIESHIETMEEVIEDLEIEVKTLTSPMTADSIKLYIDNINELHQNLTKINREILKKEDKLNQLNRVIVNIDKAIDSLNKEKQSLNNNCSLCGTSVSIEKLAKEGNLELNKVTLTFEKKAIERDIAKELANIDDFNVEYLKIEKIIKEYKDVLTRYPELSSIEEAVEDRSEKKVIEKLRQNIFLEKENAIKLKSEISSLRLLRDQENRNLEARKNEIKISYNRLFEEYKSRLVIKEDNHEFHLGFLDFKSITGSGTDIDLKRLTRYLTYFEIFNNFSSVMIPQAIDSVIFTEASIKNQKQIFKTIEEKYLTLENQNFFTILEDNLKYMEQVKIDSKSVIYLEKDKRILNSDNYTTHLETIEKILI